MWRYRDVAAYLDVSEQTVAIMRERDGLPYIKIGGTVRFSPEAVRGWAQARTVAAR